jgi:hypothetical protein
MNSIVITTISKPNRCLKSIAKKIKSKFKLIIIGDKKSPKSFSLKNAQYFSVESQKRLNFKSDKKLNYNHYSRKNLGYLIAYKNNSEYIYETDDDNLPYNTFYKSSKLELNCLQVENKKFINIYKYFSKQNIWPRGFPLRFIKDKVKKISLLKKKKIISPIQQYLADGEPDVDAIFRLIFNSQDFLKKKYSLYLPKNSYCPFNSQNTIWHRSVFALMYLPSTCSFRLTDIYRSYISQRILWELDNYLSFHPSTVRQIRNSHDLIDDFYHETDSYIKIDKLAYVLDDLKLHKGFNNIIKNLIVCYQALIKNNFIKKSEMSILKAWIRDIREIDENTNI